MRPEPPQKGPAKVLGLQDGARFGARWHLLEHRAVGENDQPVAACQGDAQVSRNRSQMGIALTHGVVELQPLDAAAPFFPAGSCPLPADSTSGYSAAEALHLDRNNALRAYEQDVDLRRAPAAKRDVDVAVRLGSGYAGNGGEGKVLLAPADVFFRALHRNHPYMKNAAPAERAEAAET